MPILKCRGVRYLSEGDELVFSYWLKNISVIKKIDYKDFDIYLTIPKRISRRNLLNIIALFYRYRIDMKQLKQFLTKENKYWFHWKGKFWYKKIFS